jgi:hypothetical protein
MDAILNPASFPFITIKKMNLKLSSYHQIGKWQQPATALDSSRIINGKSCKNTTIPTQTFKVGSTAM